MHFEINVSKNGKHLFATAPRSLTTMSELRSLYSLLRLRFPSEEGYECQAHRIETTGYFLDEETLHGN